MLKLKVAALSITNLTDARYFAAYGVEWMGFQLDQDHESYIGNDAILEIMNWVEGPKFLLETQQPLTIEKYISLNETFNFDALYPHHSPSIVVDHPLFQSHENSVSGNIIMHPDFSSYKKHGEQDVEQYILDFDSLDYLLEMENPPGICLVGGEETKVGVKSYEDLDEIFFNLILE